MSLEGCAKHNNLLCSVCADEARREAFHEREKADLRRLVEEAQAELDMVKGAFALHAPAFPALKAQVDRLKGELEDATREALFQKRCAEGMGRELTSLKGELAEARAQARDEALREAADTVHAGALAADKEAGGALASLCLSLAEHAIRALSKP